MNEEARLLKLGSMTWWPEADIQVPLLLVLTGRVHQTSGATLPGFDF